MTSFFQERNAKCGTARRGPGAAIIARGIYIPPGRTVAVGEKRLYLTIEASSQFAVKSAKAEMLRLLNEETLNHAMGMGRGGRGRGAGNFGQYSLI